MVAAGGGYGRKVIRLAGLPGGEILQDFEGADSYRLAFSPDSRYLSSGRIVWDTGLGEEHLALDQGKENVYAVAFSPDGTILAVGNKEGHVILYDARTGERLVTLKGHTDRISDVAFTPDSRVLFSSSIDGTVRRWAVAQ
jgi:WD40 repeat protein